MAEAAFKSLRELNEYLAEMEFWELEELTEAIIADADADADE